MQARRLLRFELMVADPERAREFYVAGLGFTAEGETTPAPPVWATLLGLPETQMRVARLRLGREELHLVACDPSGRAYPPGSRSSDLWFQHFAIVSADIAAAVARVRAAGAQPITRDGAQQLPPASGGVIAFKFRDPEGHPLELLQFPPGGGPAAWREGHGATLGIDHSAISVADSARSIAFYTARLGFRVAAEGVNHGPEQARLDDLAEPVVDVVTLAPAAAATPHLELLGYRAPARHRAIPLIGSDIAATRVVIEVDHITPALAPLSLADGSEAVLLHDPDGHALVLIARPD